MSRTDHAAESGRPLSVVGYHGTTRGGFAALKPNIRRGEQLGFGIHLASDYSFASLYAFDQKVARKGGKSPRVVVGLVRMNKPLYAAREVKEGSIEFDLAKKLAGPRLVTIKDEHGVRCCWLQNAIDASSPERAQKVIEDAGYDGVVYRARVGTVGVNARFTAESLSYLVFRPEQVVILEQRAEPKARASQKLVCPAEIVWDEGDTDNTLCARFGQGESHVRYTMDDAGNIRLLGIWRDRESEDGVRGIDMVTWLKSAYGRKIVVDEVAPTAIGFWDKMLESKLIARYTDKEFSDQPHLPPEPAPLFNGRRVLLDDVGVVQRFYRGRAPTTSEDSLVRSAKSAAAVTAFSPSPVVATVQAADANSAAYADGASVDVVHLAINNPLKIATASVNLGALAKKIGDGTTGRMPREAMFETLVALLAAKESGTKNAFDLRLKPSGDLREALNRCRQALDAGTGEEFEKLLSTVHVDVSALVNCEVFRVALGEIGYDGVIHRQPFAHGARQAVLLTGQQIGPEHINDRREIWVYQPLSDSQIVGAAEFADRPAQSGAALKHGTYRAPEVPQRFAPA